MPLTRACGCGEGSTYFGQVDIADVSPSHGDEAGVLDAQVASILERHCTPIRHVVLSTAALGQEFGLVTH